MNEIEALQAELARRETSGVSMLDNTFGYQTGGGGGGLPQARAAAPVARPSVLPKATGQVTATTQMPPAVQLAAQDVVAPSAPPAAPAAPAAPGIGDAYKQANALRDQAFDKLTPSDEALAQYGRAGTLGQLAGIALQTMGNEGQRAMGGQVLTKSMAESEKARRDPWKVGELEARKLEAQATALERQAQYATTQEERVRANKAAEELRADAIAARREASSASAGARSDAAGAREDARTERNRQANWRVEDSARGHFDNITKDYRDAMAQFTNVDALPTNRALSAAEMTSLVMMFGKIQDPGSVVREGEFDRIKAAQGIMQKWQNMPEQLRAGKFLPPALVNDLRAAAALYNTAAQNSIKRTAADYAANATARGLDINQIVTDRRWHPKPAGAPGTGENPAPGGNPADRAKRYY